jgi:hypothetical protein
LRGTRTVHTETPNSITADDAYEPQLRRTKPLTSLAKLICRPSFTVLVLPAQKSESGPKAR